MKHRIQVIEKDITREFASDVASDIAKVITRGIALLCALSLVACQWGTRPKTLRSAIGPHGAVIAVRVTGEQSDRTGELFAVDSAGLIIDIGDLTRVRWSRMVAMDVDQLGADYDLAIGQSITPEKLARVRLVSRFPQGLHGQLLRDVLRARGQAELREVP